MRLLDKVTDGTGILTNLIMFLSSYAPLLVILVIRFDNTRFVSTILIIVAASSIVGLLCWLRSQHDPDTQQARFRLSSVRKSGDGASAYLASYLLPFVTIENPTVRDLLAYAVFFVVAFLVTKRAGIIQVNPALSLLGYRVFEMIDQHGSDRLLLVPAGKDVSNGEWIRASRMSNDILFYGGHFETDR